MSGSTAQPELHAFVETLTRYWRTGDKAGVKSLMADDPHVAMAGPVGPVPSAVGQEAVAAMVDRFVQLLPEGAGVFPSETLGYALGEFGWLNSKCELRLPDQPPRDWHISMVLKRADDGWRFLHFAGFFGAAP